METKKKNLIVTLADANFVNQAKQLFSSVYFNAGWEGDYLLLTQGISAADKAWFENKGILVYNAPLLSDQPLGPKKYPPIVLCKFYLFKEYFKQWQKIIFLDADIIVRGSLRGLLEIKTFGAVKDVISLRKQFIGNDYGLLRKIQQSSPLIGNDYELLRKIQQSSPLIGKSFNTGVFCFDSKLINGNTFKELLSLYKEFGFINTCGEQGTINIFFYRKWKELPIIYNSSPAFMHLDYKLDYLSLRAYIVHFFGSPLPWNKNSPYYEEWLINRHQAEKINLSFPLEAKEIFASGSSKKYLISLSTRDIFNSYKVFLSFVDYLIGHLGLVIKRKSPALYKLIRLKKDE